MIYSKISPVAVSLSVFGFLSLGLLSCTKDQKAETLSLSQPSASSAASKVSFEQPNIKNNFRLITGGSNDLRLVPEGLCVVDNSGNCAKVGKLDRTKPTILYSHGWTKTGESEKIESASKWTSKFNVLLFRWHHSSYDNKLVPHDAEARIWAEQGDGRGPVALYALSEYKRMAKALGTGYKEEVRFVGHSLGSQVVVALAAHLESEEFFLQPNRIELLDPAVIGLNSILSKGIPNMSQNEFMRTTAAKAFRTQIIKMKLDHFSPFNKGSKVLISYLSATGLLDFRVKEDDTSSPETAGFETTSQQTKMCLVKDLFLKGHTQKLAGGLFGAAKLWASLNETERHQAIRKYYFDSIEQKLPLDEKGKPAFSAARTSKSLREYQGPVHFEQEKGADTVTMADDTYKELYPETYCLVNIAIDPTINLLKIQVPIWRW